MSIPDVLRMDRFLKEFQKFDKEGGLPNFSIVYLPQDHLGGGVTGRAHMADNDLALGRLIEAVSKSRYWESTALFINEDDPQNGFDHIDGHRSICLVVSAYSRPGVNHHFYNQTSVLRTILHIFGLPPLNQKDASAPLMTDCFDSQMINKEPYTALPATVALNESPPPVNKQSSIEQKWRSILATVPIERTGMKTPRDEDNLNRFIWHEQMGWETPYPAHLAGYHGKGLKELNLMVDEDDEEDEE
jgi:phospholipase C